MALVSDGKGPKDYGEAMIWGYKMKRQRDRLREALDELLLGYGYVDFISEEERQADPAVIMARAVIAEMNEEAGRE